MNSDQGAGKSSLRSIDAGCSSPGQVSCTAMLYVLARATMISSNSFLAVELLEKCRKGLMEENMKRSPGILTAGIMRLILAPYKRTYYTPDFLDRNQIVLLSGCFLYIIIGFRTPRSQ